MSEKIYCELKDLIEDENKRDELECRKYLRYAREFLMKQTPKDFKYVEMEFPSHAGKSDYVISGTISEAGEEYVQAYIWELKSPQCYIFNKKTENRLIPSKDLIEAENQLLHYYYDNKESATFRQIFDVLHPTRVCLGGIIIGCERKKVSSKMRPEKKKKLYEIAVAVRKLLYKCEGIKLVTWDQILDQLKPIKASGEKHISDEKLKEPLQELSPTDVVSFKERKPMKREHILSTQTE